MALVVVAALAVITGAAFGLSALASGGGSNSSPTDTVASAPAGTATTPFPQGANPQQTVPQQTAPQSTSQTSTNTPSPAATNNTLVYWDGMQIETTAPGVVVIDTVSLGSAADRANLEPGYQLTAVNGHQLNSATDIASAIRGLPRGRQIKVVVTYGSSGPQTVALTLGAPPSRHP